MGTTKTVVSLHFFNPAGRVVKGAKLIRLNEKLKLIFQMCVLTEMGIPAERFPRLQRQLADDIIELG
ncbi:MAG: hypothetical protein ACLP2Y_09295 [Limisphaerales bacterium]